MPYYAVANGRKIGIFLNWNDCCESVKGFSHAVFKKFDTKEDSEIFLERYKIANKYDEDGLKTQPKINLDISTQKSKPAVDFEQFVPDLYIYTDGACSNNGKLEAKAGIGIYFGMNDKRNVSKRIDGKQTNNTAELKAVIEVYPLIENDVKCGKKIAIMTDSQYVIQCVTSYGEKCHKKEWTANIPNKELVKTAYQMYKDVKNIVFIHVKAHSNNQDIHSVGNENADKLANLAIGLEECPYH